ncbi:MAG: hypothetical protein ACT4N2_06610 [Hyphomicrobium sp.]
MAVLVGLMSQRPDVTGAGAAAGAMAGAALPLVALLWKTGWKIMHVVTHGTKNSIYYVDLTSGTRYFLKLFVLLTFVVVTCPVGALAGYIAFPAADRLSGSDPKTHWFKVAVAAIGVALGMVLSFAYVHASWIGMHWDTPSLLDFRFWISISPVIMMALQISGFYCHRALSRLATTS